MTNQAEHVRLVQRSIRPTSLVLPDLPQSQFVRFDVDPSQKCFKCLYRVSISSLDLKYYKLRSLHTKMLKRTKHNMRINNNVLINSVLSCVWIFFFRTLAVILVSERFRSPLQICVSSS